MKGYNKRVLVKPTLEEVKERYKNAKLVKDVSEVYNYTNGIFDITCFNELIDEGTEYHFGLEGFDSSENDEFVTLWSNTYGFAEIIEYKSKQKPMKKVIRLDEPKEESKKPIELTHYLNDRGWEGVTNDLEMNSIKEVKLIPDTQVIYEDLSLFLVKFNDNKYIVYKGHLNDGVY